MHFCTSNSEICTGILLLPTVAAQWLLLFVMPSKLNFWLLKAFLKSPPQFSDSIFHYLIKAMITAKNVLNVKGPGMLMVSASMLQGQGAAMSYDSLSTWGENTFGHPSFATESKGLKKPLQWIAACWRSPAVILPSESLWEQNSCGCRDWRWLLTGYSRS